jgi:hypothetical protein
VDGRLVYEGGGMVFRTPPMVPQTYDPSRIRACRELGVHGPLLNWFHGGKTVASMDRTSFYTSLSLWLETLRQRPVRRLQARPGASLAPKSGASSFCGSAW